MSLITNITTQCFFHTKLSTLGWLQQFIQSPIYTKLITTKTNFLKSQ